MLQIRGLHYSIGEQILLGGVDWNLQPEKRFALIGPNGSGKTTLLRILTGDIEPKEGRIVKPRDYRIGYLPQEEVAVGRGTVLENALAGLPEIKKLEEEITALHHRMDRGEEDSAALLKKLGPLEQRFQDLDGYVIESRAKKILFGLGFDEAQLAMDFKQLSGGWGMRVYLARLLLLEPDLLLLDEPTNHLDIPSMEWLEQYLLHFKGSIVIVSHDRFFIDRLCHEIYELDRGQLIRYRGNYHFYEGLKEERIRLVYKRWEEQQTERERVQRFINKYRSDKRRAGQVQSRLRMLEKMETVELPPPPPDMQFSLKVERQSYKDVLTMENVSFRYDADWVLKDINLSVTRGEKMAMVGVNGAGKTTLTRLIARTLQPQKGRVSIGSRVTIGYYAQHQINALNLGNTVFNEVASSAATGLVTHIRAVLGTFQFGDEDIKKKVKVLSGGEKARVALAKILLSPVNFLIMDEPTTHLDITAREALETALLNYDGAVLLISHDRYFLDKLITRTLELKNGSLEEYSGNYSYYLWKRERKADEPAEEEPNGDTPADDGPFFPDAAFYPAATGKKTRDQKRAEAQARQSVSRERNRLEKNIARLEEDIEKTESKKGEIEALLARPETYQEGAGVDVPGIHLEYADLKKRIDVLYKEWEAARIGLERLISGLQTDP